MLERIATKLDFFLPFRSLAPMIVKARETILSDRARLHTREGLFNLLAFRGVFYGSPFARDDLRWFKSFDDWLAFEAKNKSKGKAYFVCANAYGSAQSNRNTSNLKQYWEKSLEWYDHQRDNPDLDPLKLHTFFRTTFHNVGDLTAMLMVGDLAEAKFIAEPKVQTMGMLVAQAKKGAKKTLVYLRLVDVTNSSSDEDVVQAFVELDEYCKQALGPGKVDNMKYGPVMLEHALCKHGRLIPRPKLTETPKGTTARRRSRRNA